MCIRDSIVVDVRKDANAQVILNQLYQYTQLQDTVGVKMCIRDRPWTATVWPSWSARSPP